VREGRDAFGRRINPCLSLYGRGPEGETCRRCDHLLFQGGARMHSKCDLRRITSGAATDHSQDFPACGKFCRPEGRES
jgi:hypothetical protein